MILCASSAVSVAGAGWIGAGWIGASGRGAAVVLAGAAEVCDCVGLADDVLRLALGLGALLGAELDVSGSLPQPARNTADSARAIAVPPAVV
ncbi:hypothetical protein J2M53_10515 [Arthrobacter sp. zg-ZUI100]|uniref:hypothetical protein n=1 Tax=Arthrobacter jiangjiafuii TaxID=2817475 RepID=UPI001AEF01E8|nr:hypothetical protein [Arthrobacter jiangjiafuii]MBP3036681.1 hypothetical protein [Arthrobacter jiangjiafuii]